MQQIDQVEELVLLERPNLLKLAEQVNNTLIYPADRIRLCRYRSMAINGRIKIRYARKSFNDATYGRFFPAVTGLLSATYQWRKIRATLFGDDHNNIVIKNCHSVLLEQLYKKKIGGLCPALTRYNIVYDEIINSTDVLQDAVDRYNKNNDEYLTKRDMITSLFTIALYGGGVSTFEQTYGFTPADYVLPAFFTEFNFEMKRIGSEIINLPDPYIIGLVANYRAARGTKAKDHILLSLILQDIETGVVCAAIDEFSRLTEQKIAAYTYNGFICTKGPQIDRICAELSAGVLAKTNYSMVFLDEPFGEPLEAPKWQIPPVLDRANKITIDDFREVSIDNMSAFVIATCAYITGGGASVWVTKRYSLTEPEYQIIPSSTLKTTLVDFVKGEWKLSAFMREMRDVITYKKIDFYPFFKENDAPKGIFNLFNGFLHSYQDNFQINVDKIIPVLNHIFNVWCNQNREANEYILNWLAGIIQRPANKTGVAVLLKSSSQGAGKSIICNFFAEKVLGPRYAATLTNNEHLFNKFNAGMENKLFVILNKLSSNGKPHKLTNRLKTLITHNEIRIEHKGIDHKIIRDFTNYILLANNDIPIKVEATDRRYFTLEVSNQHANNPTYFKPLVESLTLEAGNHFYHYLARRDICGFDPAIIPMTNLKRELRLENTPPTLMFMYKIALGEIGLLNAVEAGILTATTSYLFTEFMHWAANSNIRHNVNMISFGKEISRVVAADRAYMDGRRVHVRRISLAELKNKCETCMGV